MKKIRLFYFVMVLLFFMESLYGQIKGLPTGMSVTNLTTGEEYRVSRLQSGQVYEIAFEQGVYARDRIKFQHESHAGSYQVKKWTVSFGGGEEIVLDSISGESCLNYRIPDDLATANTCMNIKAVVAMGLGNENSQKTFYVYEYSLMVRAGFRYTINPGIGDWEIVVGSIIPGRVSASRESSYNQGEYQGEIMNLYGQVVKTFTFWGNSTTVYVGDLQRGNYVLKLTNPEGIVSSQRVAVSR